MDATVSFVTNQEKAKTHVINVYMTPDMLCELRTECEYKKISASRYACGIIRDFLQSLDRDREKMERFRSKFRTRLQSFALRIPDSKKFGISIEDELYKSYKNFTDEMNTSMSDAFRVIFNERFADINHEIEMKCTKICNFDTATGFKMYISLD